MTKERKPLKNDALLGLTFDADRLEAVLVKRSGATFQVLKRSQITLALDLMGNDPELVGREIRNQLDAEGIRATACAVNIPSRWAMSATVAVPDISGDDLESFLQIEAERSFPYPPESLQIATSLFEAGGEKHATIVAVPKDNVVRLLASLRKARLKPVTFSLPLAAVQSLGGKVTSTTLNLTIREKAVDLGVLHNGSIACLRVLEDTVESEGAEKTVLGDVVARECRITLGQLTAGMASEITELTIWGPEKLVFPLQSELQSKLAGRGIRISVGLPGEAVALEAKLPAGTPVTPSLVTAAACLAGNFPSLSFLPPEISSWQQFSQKYSGRKLAYIGGGLAAAAALVAGAFAIQQFQISSLKREWAGMSAKVSDLTDTQQQIRRFRPWYDESFRSLNILRRLSLAFPLDGAVSAKTFEIREESRISCTGTARDNQALLKTLDQLRNVPEIQDVKIDQLRGTKPVQFTFNFQWGEASSNER